MDKVTITEQDILNANSAMPLTLKWVLAKFIAENTPEKKQIVVKEKGKETISIPDMAQRRTMMETQFKIGVFVKEYMGKEFDPVHDSKTNEAIPYLMAADEADAWASFESQLDRMKRSKTPGVADKCYDILNDYHAFVRMVSIEIEHELQIRNDLLGRTAWFLSKLISTYDPEELRKSLGELSGIAGELEKGPVAQDSEATEE